MSIAVRHVGWHLIDRIVAHLQQDEADVGPLDLRAYPIRVVEQFVGNLVGEIAS